MSHIQKPKMFRGQSLPGDGFGFVSGKKSLGDQEDSVLDEALRDHLNRARRLAHLIAERAAGTATSADDDVSGDDDGVEELFEAHPTKYTERFVFNTAGLKDCYFVGHTNTDVDSVSGAIAAAELFDGIATRSEKEVNGEIK